MPRRDLKLERPTELTPLHLPGGGPQAPEGLRNSLDERRTSLKQAIAGIVPRRNPMPEGNRGLMAAGSKRLMT